MKTAKYLIPVAIALAVYFVFFASGMPKQIEYRGHTLGPREKVENNSLREFDIYSYSDGPRQHVMLFVMATTDESPPPRELLEFYVGNFRGQGFRFRSEGGRYLGSKGDEFIYMAEAPAIKGPREYTGQTGNWIR